MVKTKIHLTPKTIKFTPKTRVRKLKCKFEKTGDFYTDLAMLESTNRTYVKNERGYMGLYQLGKLALQDVKYCDKTGWNGEYGIKYGVRSEQDFLGPETANTPENQAKMERCRIVQDIAIRKYHKIIWGYLKPIHHLEGKNIAQIKLSGEPFKDMHKLPINFLKDLQFDVLGEPKLSKEDLAILDELHLQLHPGDEAKLTKAGMIAAGHLVGHRDFKDWLIKYYAKPTPPEDGNKIPCIEYLEFFTDYKIDYSTDALEKELTEFDKTHNK